MVIGSKNSNKYFRIFIAVILGIFLIGGIKIFQTKMYHVDIKTSRIFLKAVFLFFKTRSHKIKKP